MVTTGSFVIKTIRHRSVKHNHVFCSVMTTCFGLIDKLQAIMTKTSKGGTIQCKLCSNRWVGDVLAADCVQVVHTKVKCR